MSYRKALGPTYRGSGWCELWTVRRVQLRLLAGDGTDLAGVVQRSWLVYMPFLCQLLDATGAFRLF